MSDTGLFWRLCEGGGRDQTRRGRRQLLQDHVAVLHREDRPDLHRPARRDQEPAGERRGHLRRLDPRRRVQDRGRRGPRDLCLSKIKSEYIRGAVRRGLVGTPRSCPSS
jgi:hypothetical protein